MMGNMTILVGVENDKVSSVIRIIGKYSKSRKQLCPLCPRWRGDAACAAC
jgi:uncharacterized protein YaaQ